VIDGELGQPPLALVPVGTLAVEAPARVMRGAGDELRFDAPPGTALRWTAWVGGASPAAPERAPETGPAPASARVKALAHAWADDAPTPIGKARAIERRLRDGYGYDLRSPSRGAPDPLDDFLFVTRRGHCELFATALAVMLREVGVPSRVVTGLLGGEYNAFGRFYAVRESDAHAWAEAWVDGTWLTLDGTPAAPRPRAGEPLGSARDLAEALARRGAEPAWMRGARWIGAAAAALLLLGWLLRRAARGRRHAAASGDRAGVSSVSPMPECDASALYARLDVALAARGVPRDASLPPLRHAEALAAKHHPLAPEIGLLTHVYLEARFGGAALTPDARRAFEKRVRRLERGP
jgi:transglutaminase-like putative cysteine protease